jgi:uncharacterized protein (TIGR00251 family)
MIRPVKGGCQIRLRVKPRASREAILGRHGAALKVAVSQPPEKGRANRAVCGLLARALEVPSSSISVVSGETSPDKVVRIADLEAEECRRRLLPYLGERGSESGGRAT